MCGRYTITSELDEIINTFAIVETDYEYTKRYNVAPTQIVPGIILKEGKRVLSGFRWGLIPFWSKDPKIAYKMINARAEGIEKKPAFRSLLKRNRILIPSNGFYEWRKEGEGKQPYRFQMKTKAVYAFAGLYDTWRDSNGEPISTCTIITTTPNQLVSDVHDRMPVILTDIHGWLNPEMEDVSQFLKPFPADEMMKYPVSRDVGNVKNSDESLIKEIPLNSK
ncbi:SOS response-associated peptidase [Paenibacillus sp. 2TAB26]|uniref:SOS response-associated peptidase n=1 Tax=Paenibacillus sp. 2TAB26 TaxID=3233005 RepID=UPI003F944121